MLFLIRNYDLIKDREKTYLTSAVSVGDTSIIVRAVDSNAWADNDWIIIGEIGTKNAEIMQINGNVSDGYILTIDNAGSGGTRFSHSIDEPVYRIDFNQIEISRAVSPTGSKSVLATIEIQPDDVYTRYEDINNATGYGFVRFKNSYTGLFSDYSDAIPYTGFTKKSLGRMRRAVRRLLGEPDFKFISDEDIDEEINAKQRDIVQERLWSFCEDIFSTSSVAYQRDYDINEEVILGKVHSPVFRSVPLAKIDANRFDILHWNATTTGNPTHFSIWQNKIRLYPLPTTGAAFSQLNGAISSTATTITLTSASQFSPSGRIIIDNEVISYNYKTPTQLLGCVRGLEGTTAAAHSDGAMVLERDIIYKAYREPDELKDLSDETIIPDPYVLIYGAAMELAIGKLQEQVLHDRLKLKYDEAVKKLREKFGKKTALSNYRIKDKAEIISDVGSPVNPNDYLIIN